MARRSSTRVLVVLAALILFGSAAGTWWLLQRSEGAGEEEPQADVADEGRPPATAEEDPLAPLLPDALGFQQDTAQAQAAAAALAGITSDEDVDARLATGTREAIEGVDGALPVGTVVRPRQETWARRGNIAAMLVEVEPPGAGRSDVFLVWLVRDPQDEDQWLLSSTELLEGAFEDATGEGSE